MAIFKIGGDKAVQLSKKEEGFGKESGLRDFFADNLEGILGVRFLGKEYPVQNGWVDTIGLDENDSPVIIEYKWKENTGDMSDQGLFYLNWLRNNKPHFELLVKDRLGKDIKVNWSNPRLILVAQSYTQYIKFAVRERENVDLIKYSLYDGDILCVESEYSHRPERVVKKKEVISDQGEHDPEYHLKATSLEFQKLFEKLRAMILGLPDVEERINQKGGTVTYRTTKAFTRIEFKKTYIQILLRDLSYPEDTKGAVEDITSYAWGFLGKARLVVDADLPYVFDLIKASYNSTL